MTKLFIKDHYLKNIYLSEKNNYSPIINEAFKFCVIGSFGAILNFLTFCLLLYLLEFNYIISGMVGFLFPIPIIFKLNKWWTFKKNVTDKFSLLSYYVVCLIGLVLHSIALYIFTEFFNFKPLFSQIPAITCSTISNFLLSKYIVFKSTK